MKCDRVEIAFTVALFHLLKPLTVTGGQEIGGSEPLTTSFRK